MTPIEQVRDKVAQVIEKARILYGVDLSKVRVGLNLRGRTAGVACSKNTLHGHQYSVRFNHDMIVRGDPKVLKDMVEDTVPHEFAHIVCFMRPELGSNHNDGWRRVCIALGGTGGRTHDNEAVYGRGYTYEYTTNRGHKVRIGDRHHAYVQSGKPLKFRYGKGTITNLCTYSIVGMNGRTLAQPIAKRVGNYFPVTGGTVQSVPPAVLTTALPPVAPHVLPPTPPVVRVQVTAPVAGESKAAVSRRIMLTGYQAGHSYETIIAAMQAANGYDRQLARGTFKANRAKVGIPESFGK